MTLNNEKITALLRQYHSGETSVSYTLRREVEVYIYNFPRIAYRADSDSCGDFYIYMIERLDNLWGNWKQAYEASFFPWFYTMLRYRYLDFLRTKNTPPPTLPLEEDYAHPLVDDENSTWETVRTALATLSEYDRLWIKWFYLPEELTAEEIQHTRHITGKSYSELLDIQKTMIAEKLNDIDALRETSNQLSQIFEKICEQKALIRKKSPPSSEDMTALLRLEEKRRRLFTALKKPNQKLLRVFFQLFTTPREAKNRLHLAECRLRNYFFQSNHQGGAYVLS